MTAEQPVILILDGNKVIYAAFANAAQVAQIVKILQSNSLPQ